MKLILYDAAWRGKILKKELVANVGDNNKNDNCH